MTEPLTVPQVELDWFRIRRAVRSEEDAHARPIGIGCVGLEHHRDLAGVESHEIACGIDTDELDEPAHEVLIELLAVVSLQHGEDAVGRERLSDRRAAIASRRRRRRCRTAIVARFSCGRDAASG